MLISVSYAQNQDIKFDHITSEQGLSHGTVYSIIQDKEGFMWFGTRDGLNKYNGYDFVVYDHDPDKPGSISDNLIRSIYEDRSGKLWIATKNGLNVFDKSTETFKVFVHDTTNQYSISDNDIQYVYQDRAGLMWIGTTRGLNKYDPATNRFTLFMHNPSAVKHWTENTINIIYEDKLGNLWVGTTKGLSHFDRKTEKFTRYLHKTATADNSKFAGSVNAICEDRTGILWVGSMGDGVKQFDRVNKTYTVFKHDYADENSLSDNIILSLREDSFGNIWVGTQHGGLNKYDRQSGKFIRYKHLSSSPASLSDNSVMCVYEDSFKVLWVACFRGGVNKTDLLKKKIAAVEYNTTDPKGLRDSYIYSLYADASSNIWIGNRIGLDKLDRKTGKITQYSYSAAIPKNLSTNTAHSIIEDRDGNLWVALSASVKRINISTGQVTNFEYKEGDTTSLPFPYANVVYEDTKGRIWIGTRDGLALFNKNTETFKTYRLNVITKTQFNVDYIAEDQNGILWLATSSDGLNRFDPATGEFVSYYSVASEQSMNYIYKSSKGVMWVCSASGGIYQFNPQNGKYTPAQGPKELSRMVIHGILEDNSGNLWLVSRKGGLFKYDPAAKTLRNYDVHDGLLSNEFNRAFCKDSKGYMYFGSNSGLNILHPDSLLTNPYAPLVRISGFKVMEKPRSIQTGEPIVLPYNENFFSFDFVGLNYSLPEENTYAYKLEGLDEDWITAGTRRYAPYTNLDPGDYTFRVKSANYDGVWNNEGMAVKITITPPFWKTIYAYIIYVVAGIAILYYGKEYFVGRERLKHNLKLKSLESEKLHELDQMKSRFFANVSHELRTPLTLIINPLETMLAEKTSESHTYAYFHLMLRNARRLLQLINQLLDISKLEAGGMRLENEVGELMAFVKAHFFSFDSLAAHRQIKLNFHHNPGSLWVKFDKDKIEKVVTNLFSNAMKFTPRGGEISVNISVEPIQNSKSKLRKVLVTVRDTGIGIEADKLEKIFDRFYQIDSSHTRNYEGTGIGLSLTKELISLYGGNIRVESEPGKGSCFFVELTLEEVSQQESIDGSLQTHNEELVARLSDHSLTDGSYSLEELPNQLDESLPLLLIVEDHADLSSYIRNTFIEKYRVVHASNGKEGLDKAQELIPDLIISDWMMPQMTGMELCRKLKTDERTSHIPVIMLTARASMQDKLVGLENGADVYLTKPFNTEELIAQVKNLILQRRRLRERFSKTAMLVDSSKDSNKIEYSSTDEKFLKKVFSILEKSYESTDFNVEVLEEQLNMSHTQLYRKLKALTDQPPVELVRDFRLRKAAILIASKQETVSQVAYKVGFSNLSYFTKSFRKLYGVPPSEYGVKDDKLGQD
ncbi:response regulator [Rhodocytophaga rosea]|uniref:histidine kinase n=1 Tax=Rhodocytophaga rosea TaxID=2704465 RepID=A0A6C0GV13_9BACT|nr:two-component regulator propeller domain-containing protein [Rhodocytophaga rosea]QHT71654.1 response regulator [Rhodocytophaga rosea]